MLKFEGTKHERLVILVLAYVIGISTAYIAFGVNAKTELDTDTATTDSLNSTKVISEQPTELVKDETGLYYVSEGNKRLLTANQAALLTSIPDIKKMNGIYYDITDYALSPNERFAYFCEQLSEVPTECEPFVYDSETDVLYRLALPGEAREISIVEHQFAWLPDGKLQVNDFVSTDSETPWK